MVDIGILEPATHAHMTYYVTRSVASDNNHVTLFTTSDILKEIRTGFGLQADNLTVNEFSQNKSRKAIVESVASKSTDMDFLFMISFHSRTGGLRALRNVNMSCPIGMYINTANSWLGSGLSFTTEFSLRKNIQYNVRSYFKRQIIRDLDAIFVEQPRVKQYIQKELGVSTSTYVFPPVLFEGCDPPPMEEVRHFVIPGNIHPNRRNYKLALDGFVMSGVLADGKAKLTLLGRPDGQGSQAIISRCRELHSKGYNIKWFSEWVPRDRFDSVLQSADVILLPQRKEKGAHEIYGITGGAGGVFEGIRQARPILLPAHFPVPGWIDSSTKTFNDASDLADLLETLSIQEETLKSLADNALENAKNFNLNAQQSRFNDILRQMQDAGIICY